MTVGLATGIAFLAYHFLIRDRLRELRFQVTDEPIYLQEPGHERTGHRYLYDANLGWRNIPSWSATTNGQTLTINSKGLRDREHSYDKPENTKRILVLGDSYAWGYGVADDEIFTTRLQDLVDTTPFVPMTRYSIINCGVSGWGTDQEYLFLLEEGFKYSPDLVVLAFFIVNDIQNNSASIQYGMNKPLFLNRSLQLANVPVPRPFSDATPIRCQDDPVQITISIIERMNEECEKHNCGLVVMKFGQFLPGHDINPQLQKANRELVAELSDRLKVPFFDLDEEFFANRIASDTLLRGNDDSHWNANGHELVADYLFEFLSGLEQFQPD